MKRLFQLSLLILAFSGCKKEEVVNVTAQDKALYSQNDLNKYIIEKNVTVFTTGFNDVLSDPGLAFNKNDFIRFFADSALFFDDKTGNVVIEGNDGITISDPANKNREGKSNENDMDADGKKIVPKWSDIINYTGSGFYQYNLKNPKTNATEKYTSYVKSISKADAYFHSGYFSSNKTQLYSSNEMNEQLVKNAVIPIADAFGNLFKGLSLDSTQRINLMRKFLDNIRFFDNKSGYFYVLDLKGVNFVQPPDHSVQGTNRYDLKDSRGTYLVRGLIDVAQAGGGFYSYYYLNPSTNKEEMKKAYVKLIPGTNYFLGAGVYLN